MNRVKFIAMLIPCLVVTACGVSPNIAKTTTLETLQSLAHTPAGAVELTQGAYQSLMLGKDCGFRVFSPVAPYWTTRQDKKRPDGMRLVVYVMNIDGVPRKSLASDREIIEELIRDNFLVVAVDFGGGAYAGHLEMQKDIHALFMVFCGRVHDNRWVTESRKALLDYPGPNSDLSFASYPYVRADGTTLEVQVNPDAVYVVPSGYAVDPGVVFKRDYPREEYAKLFMDVIYPVPPVKEEVPALLEMSSNRWGDYVVNCNTPILYSWLFNGYAFSIMNFAEEWEDKQKAEQWDGTGEQVPNYYPFVHGVKFLRSQREKYNLSDKIATVGVSKSSVPNFSGANVGAEAIPVDQEPYGWASGRVEVCMPCVPQPGTMDERYLDTLDHDSPAIVWTWNHLNNTKLDGSWHRMVRDAYTKAGIGARCLYFSTPEAGHEYDIYHLNEIMEFYDAHCK